MDISHRQALGWARALIWVYGALVLLEVAIIGLAVLIIAIDESRHDDGWDGLGTGLGLMALLVMVPAWIVTVVLMGSTRRARQRAATTADLGPLVGAANVSIAGAVGIFLLSLAASVSSGLWWAGVMLLPCAAVCGRVRRCSAALWASGVRGSWGTIDFS